MTFDLRSPLGAMFTLYGALLSIYGLASDKSQYAKSLGLNVNLGWGAVLLAFGLTMLLVARRAKR